MSNSLATSEHWLSTLSGLPASASSLQSSPIPICLRGRRIPVNWNLINHICLYLIGIALVITTMVCSVSQRFNCITTRAMIAGTTFYILHSFYPGLLKRGSVGILYFIALECSRVLQRSINPGLLKRGSVGLFSSIDLGSPRDVILCIVHARRPCLSRYILSYQESYQESSHNKLTTDRRTHLRRHYETNWASLPWGFEMINKRLARAYSICASIVFKATSIASMIESNH